MDGCNKPKHSAWREVLIKSYKWEVTQQGHQKKYIRKEDEAHNKKDEFPFFLGTSKIISAIECNKGGKKLLRN